MKKEIMYLVLDVDGTLTDGKIYLSNSGEEMKSFNIKDGFGLNNLLKQTSIHPVVLTGRTSQIVYNRCSELGIRDVYQGVNNKLKKLSELIDDFGEIAFMGDDDNDLECMETVSRNGGVVGCPKDASKRVLAIANYVSPHNGGDGAVRDFIEWLLNI